MEELNQLVGRVEAEVRALEKMGVSSRAIGDLVMKQLRDPDELAYILFALVYVPLNDLESPSRLSE